MKVDAHQHFWRLADRAGQWPPASLAAIHRDFLPEDFAPLRGAAGIDATVLVQSLPTEDDTRFLLDLADRHDHIRGVVGWVDLTADDAPTRIEALSRHPKLKGLRPMLQDLPDDWIAQPAVGHAAEAMGRHGLVFDALVLPGQLAPLAGFARRHPGLRIVIDHGAKPFIARGEIEPWRSELAQLAAMPQVHCKLSGLLTEAGPHRHLKALLPYVQALWALFGPDRLLWGSDWPVVELASGYAHWMVLSEELLAAVTPAADGIARAAVFGGNALRLYQLSTGDAR